MNFKDVYKSYNDEIKGDPKILDAILNTSKKEDKKIFFIRPSFVGAMAAMVVIAVSVFGFNNFDQKKDSPKRTYIAATNPDDKIIPDTRIVAGNSGEISEITPETQSRTNVESNVNTQTPEVPAQTGDYGVMPAEEDGGLTIPDMPMTGRMVPSDSGEFFYEEDMVTTEDCYSYFGFGVTEKAKLPDDMTFGGNVIINAEKSDETGDMEYCSFSIDAYSQTDPQRILDLCVTKSESGVSPSDVEYFISSETGEISGGSFSNENILVKVNSIGLTQAEVEELLNSLK